MDKNYQKALTLIQKAKQKNSTELDLPKLVRICNPRQ